MTNTTKSESTNGNVILWGTAFFIMALIFVTVGRHTAKASANSVNTADGFTLLTTSNGQNSTFLHIIDNSTSMYMVYNIPDPQNKASIETVATWFLPAMFTSARN